MAGSSLHHNDGRGPQGDLIVLTKAEFERISSCASALHSVTRKCRDLDPVERDDLLELSIQALSRILSQINERLSDELHGSSDAE